MQYPIQLDSAGGEYMEAVVILEWVKPVGAKVKAGEHIATVETAKAATEVEAPADGYLVQIRFNVGQEAPIGEVLGLIADSMAEVSAPTETTAPAAAEPTAPVASVPREGRVVASPLARRIAAQAGVDLAQIKGTGPNGRIKRRDVEAAAKAPAPLPLPTSAQPAQLAAPVRVTGLVPVVMIHGFGADRSNWRQVAGLIDADRPVILPDLPGHGQAPAAQVTDIVDLAEVVATGLHARGIETAHLVGHSLGGAVAITLADQGLITARSLALIAPGGLGPEVNTGFIRGLARAATEEELQPWLDVMVADPGILPPGMARAVIRSRAQQGNGAALIALADTLFGDTGQKMRLAARLARLDMPAKVIWGLRDRIIPVSHADDLPGHIGLHRLAEVGHVPQIEKPALVARLLNELHRSAE